MKRYDALATFLSRSTFWFKAITRPSTSRLGRLRVPGFGGIPLKTGKNAVQQPKNAFATSVGLCGYQGLDAISFGRKQRKSRGIRAE
jgi:hypothetical protein